MTPIAMPAASGVGGAGLERIEAHAEAMTAGMPSFKPAAELQARHRRFNLFNKTGIMTVLGVLLLILAIISSGRM
jgi:hypothetical protein